MKILQTIDNAVLIIFNVASCNSGGKLTDTSI